MDPHTPYISIIKVDDKSLKKTWCSHYFNHSQHLQQRQHTKVDLIVAITVEITVAKYWGIGVSWWPVDMIELTEYKLLQLYFIHNYFRSYWNLSFVCHPTHDPCQIFFQWVIHRMACLQIWLGKLWNNLMWTWSFIYCPVTDKADIIRLWLHNINLLESVFLQIHKCSTVLYFHYSILF